MNGAQKRTVAATLLSMDKDKTIANGTRDTASNGASKGTHRAGLWYTENSNVSQNEQGNGLDLTDEKHDEDEDEDDDVNDSFYIPSKSFAKQLSALDPYNYQGSGDDFCTEENFEQTSAYVNHQLSVFGFSSNLCFFKADKAAASRIVTALYKVLQQHQKDAEYKEEMDLNWRRLSQDYDSTVQTLNNTKARLERLDRENVELQAKLGSVEDELRGETEKHRQTREELRSAKANLQYTKTQYAHEARRKEKEMDALKEKVQKSMSRGQALSGSGSTVIPGGITVLNPVPRLLFGKQHVSEGEQLLKDVIEQQKAKELEIIEENEQLRRTLYTVHVEVEGLVNKVASPTTNSLYGLPFDMIKEKIETEIQDALTLLSDQWNHRPIEESAASPADLALRDERIGELEQEVQKLQHELEDSTLLIQGAQKMIDNLNRGHFLAGVQSFEATDTDGTEDMTAQELQDTEAKLQQQREDLAKERKKFTEACLDLGRQREELQKAQVEFEESKRTFRLDKVVSFLSFSPGSSKRTLEYSPPTSPLSTPQRQQVHRAKKRMTTTPLPSLGPRLGTSKASAITIGDGDAEVVGHDKENGVVTVVGLEKNVDKTPSSSLHADRHEQGTLNTQHSSTYDLAVESQQETDQDHSHNQDDERGLVPDGKDGEVNDEEEEEEDEEDGEEELLRTPTRSKSTYRTTLEEFRESVRSQRGPLKAAVTTAAAASPVRATATHQSNGSRPKTTVMSSTVTGATSTSTKTLKSSLSMSSLTPSTSSSSLFKPSVPFTFTSKAPSSFGSATGASSSSPTTSRTASTNKVPLSSSSSLSSLAPSASNKSTKPSSAPNPRPSTPLFSSSQRPKSTGASPTRKTHVAAATTGTTATSLFSRARVVSSNNDTTSSTNALAAATVSALKRNPSQGQPAPVPRQRPSEQQRQHRPTTVPSTSSSPTPRRPPPSKQAQQIYANNQQTFLSSRK
ncbi:hypothetical protein BGZ94_009143 [Podila epigama]|nr:hypothetical protein BGZ94_009143 [Podila epigama]